MLNLSVFHGIGFGVARCTLTFAIPLDVICRAIPLLQTFAAGLAGRTHSVLVNVYLSEACWQFERVMSALVPRQLDGLPVPAFE